MKKIILIFLLCSSATAFAQKTNFSGNWMIDKSKIDFGRAPEWILPKIVKVGQTLNKITISRVLLDRDLQERAPAIEILDFDGTPFQRTTPSGPVVTSVRWLNDQSLMVTRKGVSITKETWTLDDSAKTLIINLQVEQNDGLKYSLKCFYDKQ